MRNPIISKDLATITSMTLGWDRLFGSTFLIAGGAGFIPSYMAETLLYLNETCAVEKPIKVILLVRNLMHARKRFSYYRNDPNLQLVQHDICTPYNIGAPVDYIVHAASQASPKYYGCDPVGTLSANVFGTRNLLELAREKNVASFLFLSGGVVNGQLVGTHMPIREDDYGSLDPTEVGACYAESKRIGETMCAAWNHQFGVPAKIVRIYHVYGPGMRLDDGRVFADFVSDVVHGNDIRLNSNGSTVRAFCYLSDATLAFFKVLIDGKCVYPYNVGNDAGQMSILDLAKLLVSMYPMKKLNVIRMEPSEGYIQSNISRSCPDLTRLRLLGWEPCVTVADGFARTIESYLVDQETKS